MAAHENGRSQSPARMSMPAALQALADFRTDQVVITTMGAAREWPKISSHPLDFHYIPSAMGQAPALGLGVALAQPQREVIVLNGDGSMLMNLGVLVTIVAARATNLTIVVLENGLYEVTGGQQTAAAGAGTDLVAIAQGAGLKTVARFDGLEDWRQAIPQVLAAPGPRFVLLRVEPVSDYLLEVPGPIGPRIAQFRGALARP